jgi:hypothetical protein
MAMEFSSDWEMAFVTFGGEAPDLVTTGVSLMSKCQQFVTGNRSHVITQVSYAILHGTSVTLARKGYNLDQPNASRVMIGPNGCDGGPECYRSFNIRAVANVLALPDWARTGCGIRPWAAL